MVQTSNHSLQAVTFPLSTRLSVTDLSMQVSLCLSSPKPTKNVFVKGQTLDLKLSAQTVQYMKTCKHSHFRTLCPLGVSTVLRFRSEMRDILLWF